MKGTRVEPDADGQLLLKEGEYGKDRRGVWMCRPPGSHMGSLQGHQVNEHTDGSISVTPSILIDDGRTKWHGYLTNGEWRMC
jgi:hypothetical protein